MTNREAYTKKIEAELELAQATLITWKAKAKDISADLSIEYNKHVGSLERSVDSIRAKLTEVTQASEDSWQIFKEGIDNAAHELGHLVKAITARFKDLH